MCAWALLCTSLWLANGIASVPLAVPVIDATKCGSTCLKIHSKACFLRWSGLRLTLGLLML